MEGSSYGLIWAYNPSIFMAGLGVATNGLVEMREVLLT